MADREPEGRRKLVFLYDGFGGGWYWFESACTACGWQIGGCSRWWKRVRFWLHRCEKEADRG